MPDASLVVAEKQYVRIPLRLRPGEVIPFVQEDVVLQSGDVVYIQARDTELFYTGGLLPPGEFVLPRDYDLDVVEAVTRVQGPFVNGGLSQNNFTGQVLQSGLGFPSPSQLSVVRRTPGGGQLVIKVDLNRALNDPRERILVQPGDLLVLQETIGEAVGRYVTQAFSFQNFNFLWRRNDSTGTTSLTLP
jgi:hypothetical protein